MAAHLCCLTISRRAVFVFVIFTLFTNVTPAEAQSVANDSDNGCTRGFNNLTEITLNDTISFIPEGDYIFPELQFLCNGTLTTFNFSILLDVGYAFDLETHFRLKLWQFNGSGYEERASQLVVVTFRVSNANANRIEPSRHQLLSLTVALDVDVWAGDTLGISPIPAQPSCVPEVSDGQITCRAFTIIVGAPIVIAEDAVFGQPVLRQSGPCWDFTRGLVPCSFLYLIGRPHFEIGFQATSPPIHHPVSNSADSTLGMGGVDSNTLASNTVIIITVLAVVLGVVTFVLVVVVIGLGCLLCCQLRGKRVVDENVNVHYQVYSSSPRETEESTDKVSFWRRRKLPPSAVKNTYAQLSCVDDSEPSTFLRERDRLHHKKSRSSMNEAPIYAVPISRKYKPKVTLVDNEEVVYENVSRTPVESEHEEIAKDNGPLLPSSRTEHVMYSQTSASRHQEIQRSALYMGRVLGEGEFGTVHYATWHQMGKPLVVAVKVCNEHCSTSEKLQLMREAAIIGQFDHPRVVRLYGVVTLSEPNMLVMEYIQNGTLESHLHRCRDFSSKSKDNVPCRLLRFCQEIADGMRYLAHKNFIHRDLAARNILLDKDYHCKIADFGLTRRLTDSQYYQTKGGRLPLRWTPPEAILYNKFSTMGDIWTFGIVMYEIWSLGEMPYKYLTTDEIIHLFTRGGYCLPPPPGCPREIYRMMVNCWNPDYHKRPSFKDLFIGLSVGNKDVLLSWSENDRTTSGQADVLGAPLEEGKDLYKDLQFLYSS